MKGRSFSFQKHYSIPPPGVKPRFTIFWFLLSFLYFLSFPPGSRLWRGSAFCSPLSLAALTGVSPAPLALSRFLRRALVSACKNRSAAPLTAPCFVRWTRSLFVPPEGEPSLRPWAWENFVVRRSFLLCLTTNFAKIDAGTLASPRGGGGTALCAVTERAKNRPCGATKQTKKRPFPGALRIRIFLQKGKRNFRRSAPLWGRGSSGGAPHRPGSCPG